MSNTAIHKVIQYQALNTGGTTHHRPYQYDLLTNLIFDFRHLQCLDPRDKVYALLGLVQHENIRPQQVCIDYRRSTTDLFFDVVAGQWPRKSNLWFADVLRQSLRLEVDDLRRASQMREKQDEFYAFLVPVGVVRGVLYSKYKIF